MNGERDPFDPLDNIIVSGDQSNFQDKVQISSVVKV